MTPEKIVRFSPIAPSTARGRVFEIHVQSDPTGYSAKVFEHCFGNTMQSISLPNAPRMQLPPGDFFSMREHYRGVLFADLISEIRYGTIVQTSDPTAPPSTYYIKANMDGWPEGYPNARLDDMNAWIPPVNELQGPTE